MKSYLYLSMILILLIASLVSLSCGLLPGKNIPEIITGSATNIPSLENLGGYQPQVVNHPRPDLSLDTTPFEDVGCPLNESGFRICQEASPLLALGCWKLEDANPLMGGLVPEHALIECFLNPRTTTRDDPNIHFIYNDGCSLPLLVRYAIYDGENYRVLESISDLQASYAPIESDQEALSYAIAATGHNALYGLHAEKELRYFVESIEDSHVEKVPEGYMVHLFHYKLCGCGPHPTSNVVILVTPAGEIKEISVEKLFEDPNQDDLCMD